MPTCSNPTLRGGVEGGLALGAAQEPGMCLVTTDNAWKKYAKPLLEGEISRGGELAL